MLTYSFTAKMWQYPGAAAWYFVTLPKNISDEIKTITASGIRRGFDSVKVTAEIDTLLWETSLFPDKKSGSYMLPIKKAVRTTTGINTDDILKIKITVKDVH